MEITKQLGPRPAAKAWVGAVVTLATWALARFVGVGEEDPIAALGAAQALVEAAVATVMGYVAVWIVPNRGGK